MNLIHKNKVALVFGSFAALAHIVWSLFVALNWAQPISDFLFRLHFIEPYRMILPFNFGKAAALVVIAFFVGYIAGWVFSTIWNRVYQN